jgi:hypothetical protein
VKPLSTAKSCYTGVTAGIKGLKMDLCEQKICKFRMFFKSFLNKMKLFGSIRQNIITKIGKKMVMKKKLSQEKKTQVKNGH